MKPRHQIPLAPPLLLTFRFVPPLSLLAIRSTPRCLGAVPSDSDHASIRREARSAHGAGLSSSPSELGGLRPPRLPVPSPVDHSLPMTGRRLAKAIGSVIRRIAAISRITPTVKMATSIHPSAGTVAPASAVSDKPRDPLGRIATMVQSPPLGFQVIDWVP